MRFTWCAVKDETEYLQEGMVSIQRLYFSDLKLGFFELRSVYSALPRRYATSTGPVIGEGIIF